MTTTSRSARLQTLLAPVVEGAGCELEEVSVAAAGRRSVVRVVVDSDDGVDLDAVADVSRAVGAALDEADGGDPTLLGASYVLEVSSPGVDRALSAPRHWRRNLGRLVRIEPAQGQAFVGRLTGADETAAVLERDGTDMQVPYAEVRSAYVQVEFSREGA